MKASDRDWVSEHGHCGIDGTRPLSLRVWNPRMPICMGGIPHHSSFWACLADVHPTHCSNHMLSRFGSAIGRPVCMDEVTASCTRISYARVLAEVTPG